MKNEDLIENSRVSARLKNLCEKHGVFTIGELVAIEKKVLLSWQNLGRGTLAEIEMIVDRVTEDQQRSMFTFDYNGINEVVEKAKRDALKSQWHLAYTEIPNINDESSDIVVVRTSIGSIHLAYYSRYDGWLSVDNKPISVNYWMNIPNVE